MSKQPLGKTLLRNVIRHTDAHNKIQEETEMWKMRGWEIQTSHPKQCPDTDTMRGRMHCDRGSDQLRSRNAVSEHDDREARYWTRKLYEFEATDPDRWGHGGFKELYPEEFESDGETGDARKKIGRHKLKKSDTGLSKRSKKSSRKKKKKKKKKKRANDGKRRKDESSSSECSSDESSAEKDKHRKRKRTKSRHKSKKSVKTRARDEDSSSADTDGEKRERLSRSRKKRKQDTHNDSDSGPDSRTKKRKNWKAADESSDDSIAD
ncbi:unnamed protein product, partial [Menidia menidia]